MRVPLIPHPTTPTDAAQGIEVRVARSGSASLALHYFVSGAVDDLTIPPVGPPTRTDGLWQHSCFEAFIGTTAGEAYWEFNFSPSTQWAAYRFDRYREGMASSEDLAQPLIRPVIKSDAVRLGVEIELPRLVAAEPLRIGLSAVIEQADGRKSYWALAHPPGKPDFHHGDCFALELPAAKRP